MRLILLCSALALAACADEPDPEEKARADAAAIAEVEATQVPPPEALAPRPILYPDIERYELFGAGCSFAPKGGGLGAVALAMADEGYMKREGEILRFAADKGSKELPYLARRKYDGRDYSFTLDLDEGEGKQVGMETREFGAKLTVKDGKDRVVYSSDGLAQCGA